MATPLTLLTSVLAASFITTFMEHFPAALVAELLLKAGLPLFIIAYGVFKLWLCKRITLPNYLIIVYCLAAGLLGVIFSISFQLSGDTEVTAGKKPEILKGSLSVPGQDTLFSTPKTNAPTPKAVTPKRNEIAPQQSHESEKMMHVLELRRLEALQREIITAQVIEQNVNFRKDDLLRIDEEIVKHREALTGISQ